MIGRSTIYGLIIIIEEVFEIFLWSPYSSIGNSYLYSVHNKPQVY